MSRARQVGSGARCDILRLAIVLHGDLREVCLWYVEIAVTYPGAANLGDSIAPFINEGLEFKAR